jgi:cytoskeletal protein RodZ
MIGIGEFLREARDKQDLNIVKLSRETKIKRNFVEAIEKQDWGALPEFPVVQGFVKNISSFLGEDEKKALALLRRDYPPRPEPLVPKADIGSKFTWTPRRTFIAGALAIFLAVAVYLGFQYYRFLKPPRLEVGRPQEGEVVRVKELTVSGQTDPDVSVIINNQPATVDQEGNFETQIEVDENSGEITVVAASRSGKETVINRKIKVELAQ